MTGGLDMKSREVRCQCLAMPHCDCLVSGGGWLNLRRPGITGGSRLPSRADVHCSPIFSSSRLFAHLAAYEIQSSSTEDKSFDIRRHTDQQITFVSVDISSAFTMTCDPPVPW